MCVRPSLLRSRSCQEMCVAGTHDCAAKCYQNYQPMVKDLEKVAARYGRGSARHFPQWPAIGPRQRKCFRNAVSTPKKCCSLCRETPLSFYA